MSGAIPIYRFYRKDNKDHFYSKNIKQKNIWKPQGIEFYAVSPIDYKIQSINTMENQNKVAEEYQKQISLLQKEYDAFLSNLVELEHHTLGIRKREMTNGEAAEAAF